MSKIEIGEKYKNEQKCVCEQGGVLIYAEEELSLM